EPRVADDAGEQSCGDDIKDSAQRQRSEDPDGHVLLRILGFLRRGGDGIESNVGEKYFARAAQYARPSELAGYPGVGRNKWRPIGLSLGKVIENVCRRDRNEDQHG